MYLNKKNILILLYALLLTLIINAGMMGFAALTHTNLELKNYLIKAPKQTTALGYEKKGN